MRAIIGPNGAGKTTMMDVITGKTRPDEGDVLFDLGRVDLTRHDEAAIAGMGIGRKFQKPTVFESHTVADNILLALKGPRGPFSALFGQRNPCAGRRDRFHPDDGPPDRSSGGSRATSAMGRSNARDRHAAGAGPRRCCSSTSPSPA